VAKNLQIACRDSAMVPFTGGMALEAINHLPATLPRTGCWWCFNDNRHVDLNLPWAAPLQRTQPHAAERPALAVPLRSAEEAVKNLAFPASASCLTELKTLKRA